VSQPSATLHSFPQNGDARLRLALRSLDEALNAQARAMAEFRASLAALRETMEVLSDGFAGFQGALATTVGQVEEAQEAARRLAETAEAMDQARPA